MTSDEPGKLFGGEVVLITGAGSGIGRAAARRFAEEGARVVIADIDEDAARGTAVEIGDSGGEALAVPCDTANGGQVDALVATAVAHFGRLDGAFNNAGISGPLAATADLSEADFDRVQNVNLRGVWLCMRAQIRHFLSVGAGAIVNTTSVGGVVGAPGSCSYSAAKHGVIGLTKTAAAEYGRTGIRINALAPGLTKTPMVAGLAASQPETIARLEAAAPLARAADPRELADAAVWLMSDRASFVHGHVLVVDGGFTAL